MPFFIPALIAGASALGGLLGNRKQTSQQSGSSTTSGMQDFTGTQSNEFSNLSSPVYDPQQLQMRNFLLSQFYNRTNPETIKSITEAAINQGVNNYNQEYQGAEQALRGNLAMRGLQYSPAGANAEAQLQNSRIGNIIGLRNQAPLLQNQLQESALTDFSNFLTRLPFGTQSSGSSFGSTSGHQSSTQNTESQGTVTQPGNMLGGLFGGLGSALAALYGQGAFQKGGGGLSIPNVQNLPSTIDLNRTRSIGQTAPGYGYGF